MYNKRKEEREKKLIQVAFGLSTLYIYYQFKDKKSYKKEKKKSKIVLSWFATVVVMGVALLKLFYAQGRNKQTSKSTDVGSQSSHYRKREIQIWNKKRKQDPIMLGWNKNKQYELT